MKNEKEEQTLAIALSLNEKVGNALANSSKHLFEKAFAMSTAVMELKRMLSPEIMKPLMALQGNSLGFKTDKDDKGGYPEDVVKNCIIEATLSGFEVVGNQFNIIAGNMYGTKNGFGALLKNFAGLHYEIIFDLPRISANSTSAAVVANVAWEINGEKFKRKLDLPIKMNSYMGADAVLGKAERKARKWLYSQLTGTEIGEGDVQDVPHVDITEAPADKKKKKEEERVMLLIEGATSVKQLESFHANCTSDEAQAAYHLKLIELTAAEQAAPPVQQAAPVAQPVQTAAPVQQPAATATPPVAQPPAAEPKPAVMDLVLKNIASAKTFTELEQLLPHLKDEHQEAYRLKKIEISKKLAGQ